MIQNHLERVSHSSEITYSQVLAIVKRRWLLFSSIFLGSIATSACLFYIISPTYSSTAQFLLEPNITSRSNGGDQNSQTESNNFTDPGITVDYATQINIMRSPKLLHLAIDKLKPEYPDFELKDLIQNLSIKRLSDDGDKDKDKPNSKVIKVVYTDKDPLKTQRVLQVLQDIYHQDYQVRQQQRLNNGLAFINQQIPQVEKRLNQATAALTQFRKRYRLVDINRQSQSMVEMLSDVQKERRAAYSQYQDAKERYTYLRHQVAKSPQEAIATSRLSESSRYQKSLDELQKIELDLAQKQAQFTDESPIVQNLKIQRDQIRSILPAEMQRILGSGKGTHLDALKLLNQGEMGNLDLKLVDQLVAVNADLKALSSRNQILASAESQLREQIKQFPALMDEYERLTPVVELNRKLLQDLLQAQQNIGMEVSRGSFDWQVLAAPWLGKRVSLGFPRYLALGTVVGFFAGLLAAWLRDISDDAVHTPDELRRHINVPLLGMIPDLPKVGDLVLPPSLNAGYRLPTTTTQLLHWVPFREAMDLIYKTIQMLHQSEIHSILMTSTLPQEGKSTLALGLAISAARLQHRVLLIDADLRYPSLHQKLGIPNLEGLSTLLSQPSPAIAPQHLALTNGCLIDVLPAGPVARDPVQLLSSSELQSLIRYYESQYDLVVVDAPPVSGMVDALLIASICSGVVVTGRRDIVTHHQVKQTLDTLSPFNILGVIANAIQQTPGYYSSAYYEGDSPQSIEQKLTQPPVPVSRRTMGQAERSGEPERPVAASTNPQPLLSTAQQRLLQKLRSLSQQLIVEVLTTAQQTQLLFEMAQGKTFSQGLATLTLSADQQAQIEQILKSALIEVEEVTTASAVLNEGS